APSRAQRGSAAIVRSWVLAGVMGTNAACGKGVPQPASPLSACGEGKKKVSRPHPRDGFAPEVCKERTLERRAGRRVLVGPAGLSLSRGSGGTMLFDEASSR